MGVSGVRDHVFIASGFGRSDIGEERESADERREEGSVVEVEGWAGREAGDVERQQANAIATSA
jgi:hypothetical protein